MPSNRAVLEFFGVEYSTGIDLNVRRITLAECAGTPVNVTRPVRVVLL